MKHKLKISVSKQPQTGGIVTCKNLTVRERLLRFLFGDKRRVTILIPGDSVDVGDPITELLFFNISVRGDPGFRCIDNRVHFLRCKDCRKIPFPLHGGHFLVIPGNLKDSFIEKLDG